MKTLLFFLVTVLVSPGVLRAAEADRFPKQLLAFSAAKEQQVRQLAKDLDLKLPPEIIDYFKSATQGDYESVSNAFARLVPEYANAYRNPPGSRPEWTPFFQPMNEVESAYELFAVGGTKYPPAFGGGIIQAIPAGSIYFGGTDAGRMLVTALCESHAQARPFYTLTQNALSDGRYMDYLRAMYGKRIYLPTTNDVQTAVEEYKTDALRRLKHDEDFPDGPRQVMPGEDVRVVDGEMALNNQVSVMAIHARLVKVILEHNPKCEFFMEESFPLFLINPYLSPHGLIFQLNHEPLKALTGKMLDDDHAFWTKKFESMLGTWLKPDTSVSNVCAFVDGVYGRKDWSHFTGDRVYVTNDFAPKAFSKLRVSIAGLYQWRLTDIPKGIDRARLQAETDYAFKQAFALCPTSPEAVFRYINFLLMRGRFDDAILIAGAAQKLDPSNEQFPGVLSQLQRFRKQQDRAAEH